MLGVNQAQKKGLWPPEVPSILCSLWFCVLSYVLIWGNLQYTDSFTGLQRILHHAHYDVIQTTNKQRSNQLDFYLGCKINF